MSRIAAATPVTTVRGAGDASASSSVAALAARPDRRACVTGLPPCWVSPAAGGPAIPCPAIPPRPILLKVLAESSNGAAAAAPALGSGKVIETERISGAATVQFDGTDNAPTVSAWPRLADMVGADAAIGPGLVMIAGNSSGGLTPVPGHPS